jgi:hypothetical protein
MTEITNCSVANIDHHAPFLALRVGLLMAASRRSLARDDPRKTRSQVAGSATAASYKRELVAQQHVES